MQSQQMAAMAAMNANARGPVDGTPIMGNMQRPGQPQPVPDPREKLNTYIYDYFQRNSHFQLAQMMLECKLPMSLKSQSKPSPNGRNVNGVDAMDKEARDGLPEPNLPEGQLADNSFLLDWWAQFWDIFMAARKQQPNEKGTQYITHTRNLTQMHNDQRNQRMMMANNAIAGAPYQMMRVMPNGVATNDLKRAAAINNRNPNGNSMANMQMKNQAMLSAQMQRDGSGMDMNGQRPQSPGSSDHASSPNKRPRVEGNHFSSPQMGAARSQGMPQPPMGPTSAGQANQMLLAGGMNAGNMPGSQFNEFAQQAQNVQQKSIEVYAQSLAHQQRIALNNHAMAQGMNSNQQGLDGQVDMFAGNQPRPNISAAPGQPQGNHALQDYQMQLMLLEQQNKKRLLMARQEQDNLTGGPHAQPAVGAPGYPPSMSPQGSRAGPSPNPIDQMKRGTPKMNQHGLPGSPMPDIAMSQQRGSPTPNMNFDPSQMPPGIPPQFYNPGMQPNAMQRPPSSHPGFNGQQLTPQQMEQMRQSGVMQNGGAWRGGPPGIMQQGQQQGPMGNNPQQRNQMPPPPAPAGEQPRAQEPSPSQTAQAPPTPVQGNKANPKKKVTKTEKKATKGKGSGATPAASAGDEPPTPTPSTPITANHQKSFQNGQAAQPPAQPPAQPQPTAPQHSTVMDTNPPFGNLNEEPFDINLGFGEGDALESFDFDSFLHVGGDDATGFNSLGGDFGFGDTVEAGGDL